MLVTSSLVLISLGLTLQFANEYEIPDCDERSDTMSALTHTVRIHRSHKAPTESPLLKETKGI